MPSNGKHRRPSDSPVKRRLVVAGTGLVLPVIAAGAANAAPHKAPATDTTLATAHKASPQEKAATAKDKAKATSKAAPKHRTHVVKHGETLDAIASEEGVSTAQLYQDNAQVIGTNQNLIHPGQVLAVPDGHAPAHGTPKAQAKAERAPDRSPQPRASHGNDVDGWINQSLDLMKQHGIPGTFEGIKRNVMRESSGNPMAVNNWDINAQKGTPSKGLLQVIDPTFRAYHVPGTSTDPHDPIANILAASNYAAHRYGSIDNVNGPY
ncbi:transglycosylase SLT domain-containing protein [Streptomyces sp. H27-H1]|uniref:LysM peptidoglycan-binding domain-containing protein n=1 Tax=Streptomyces sp. H27-H1 TaxID=2996461 RepID=UPI00226E6C52|nr:LysM peptidoglycan-binding domain-containing protein [Streptomyces sp. H27-H1]MCY0932166.1 transglycosylase SLT domain-containing protein [Streptomyces sp. H27-H1]